MSSWTGMLSTTASVSPASAISSCRCASRPFGHASPTGTSYSALTTLCTPGIWRMCARGIGSVGPNQRKVMNIARSPGPHSEEFLGSLFRVLTFKDEAAHVRRRRPAEVAGLAELQCAGRGRELHGVLRRLFGEQGRDQAGSEAVAPTHAIDDLHDMPMRANDCARPAVIQHGAPRVLARAEDLARGCSDCAAAEPVGELCTVGIDAQHRADCVAVSDQHIGLAREGLDERAWVAAAPQRLAVVQIEADRYAAFACGGESIPQGRSRSV